MRFTPADAVLAGATVDTVEPKRSVGVGSLGATEPVLVVRKVDWVGRYGTREIRVAHDFETVGPVERRPKRIEFVRLVDVWHLCDRRVSVAGQALAFAHFGAALAIVARKPARLQGRKGRRHWGRGWRRGRRRWRRELAVAETMVVWRRARA